MHLHIRQFIAHLKRLEVSVYDLTSAIDYGDYADIIEVNDTITEQLDMLAGSMEILSGDNSMESDMQLSIAIGNFSRLLTELSESLED